MSDRIYVVVIPTGTYGSMKCVGPFSNREVAQAVVQGTSRSSNDGVPIVYEVEKP